MKNETPVHDEDCPVVVYGLPDVICTCGAVPHRPPSPALRKAAQDYLAIQRAREKKEHDQMVEKLLKSHPGIEKARLDALALENDRLRLENDQLRAILKPFGNIKPFETGYAYWVVLGTPDRCSFTHNDLMAAREFVAVGSVDTTP